MFMDYYDDQELEREIKREFYRDYYSRLRKAQKSIIENHSPKENEETEDKPF